MSPETCEIATKMNKESVETSEEWSEWIQWLIEESGYSTGDLAEKLGVSPSNVSHWKSGYRVPSAAARKLLTNFAEELGLV
jgi:DNA-binding transcriptional regulator YiaG